MYCTRWEEFCELSHALAKKSPERTRYCVRWRHDLGFLVLKVTDDIKCIKFKTRSSLFLNRFDSFTRALLAQQQNRPPAPVAVSVLPTPSTAAIPAVAASETPEPPSGKKKKANKKKR